MMMTSRERLPFRLHDFTRVLWAGERARGVWAPRLGRIVSAWLVAERHAVRAGVRPCALQHVPAGDLSARVAAAIGEGLTMLPLALEGAPAGSYAVEARPQSASGACAFRVAIGAPAAVLELKAAWDAGRHDDIGRLLGYPSCCRAFFTRVWIDEASIDTTWAMACASGRQPAPRRIDVDGPPEANILLRWLGARAVPHLPCSFTCADTVTLAHGMLGAARDAGFAEEVEWLLEMLSWPCEWSALHGIAEIRTPIAKIATRTDATAHKLVVSRQGDAYPAEGARGLVFPYRTTTPPVPSLLKLRREPEAWRHRDNGFASARAMAEAHRPIVTMVLAHLKARPGAVLDLGCGNGALLAALRDMDPRVAPLGVDVDPLKIARARTLLPSCADSLVAGDMFEPHAPWRGLQADLAILMPGRLLEAGRRSDGLRAWLRGRGTPIVAYAYDDWIAREGDIAALCARAGLEVLDPAPGGAAVALCRVAPA